MHELAPLFTCVYPSTCPGGRGGGHESFRVGVPLTGGRGMILRLGSIDIRGGGGSARPAQSPRRLHRQA